MTSLNLIEYQLSGITKNQDINKLNAIIIRHARSSDQMCKYFCTKYYIRTFATFKNYSSKNFCIS